MTYKVKYVTSLITGYDTVYVSASNEAEAKDIGDKLLNKNKLYPSYLNDGYIICIPIWALLKPIIVIDGGLNRVFSRNKLSCENMFPTKHGITSHYIRKEVSHVESNFYKLRFECYSHSCCKEL